MCDYNGTPLPEDICKIINASDKMDNRLFWYYNDRSYKMDNRLFLYYIESKENFIL